MKFTVLRDTVVLMARFSIARSSHPQREKIFPKFLKLSFNNQEPKIEFTISSRVGRIQDMSHS